MKLIVGLGNPGNEYENTRHNVGFMSIDHYLGENNFKKKKNGMIYEININGEKIIFLKPLTFMNYSGLSVSYFMNYFNLSVEDILIIYDDMDFELGTFKLKMAGSSAGHNGIKSIINSLGTEKFKRIRIGISKSVNNKIDYVLGKFSKNYLETLNSVFNKVDEIINKFNKVDFEKLMNEYN